MRFLLFLLGLIFFFIFFLFSRLGNIEGFFIENLYFIAHIYIGISLLFIIGLFSRSKQKGEVETSSTIQELIPSSDEIKGFIRSFFSDYVYYLACLLFYTALYFIMRAMYGDVNLSLIFLFLNIIVISLYFLEHKFVLFQDFIRVNLLIISLYYIVRHSLYIMGFSYEFTAVDIMNIFGVFVLFFILLSTPRPSKYQQIVIDYFIAFCFIEASSFYKSIFGGNGLSFALVAGFMGGLFLVFTSNIHHFSGFSKQKIRHWGVFFVSLFIGISGFYVGNESINSLFLIPALWCGAYVLYLFHNTFQNYLALFFASIGAASGAYGIYTILFLEPTEKMYLGHFLIFFSWAYLFFDSFIARKKAPSKYFFHILSLLVNVLGVICFFFFYDISILSVGILLLVESLYLFFSYFLLKKRV